jgi:hypothetical protein
VELKTITDGNTGCEIVLEDFVAHGVTVPAKFRFDGASAPWVAWPIIPPYKKTKKAACVHDWLCRQAKTKEQRKFADQLFWTMLKEAKLSKSKKLSAIRSFLGYLGVRAGAAYHILIGDLV